ncbi:MAG: lipopolysaccharide biosynthesis protein [Frankiales bacterium]|nr:lipopolysaccharide biosynthesis protein [Frankiales bacterium]
MIRAAQSEHPEAAHDTLRKPALSRPWLQRTALALLGVIVAVAAADLSLRGRTTHYEASSRLVVTPLSRDNDTLVGLPLLRDLGDPIRTIETAAAVLESPDVAARAAQQLGPGWTETEVQNAVDVAPLAQTNVLLVHATTTSPVTSARVANAYARAVLSLRRVELARAAQTEIASTSGQLAEPGVEGSTIANALRDRISALRLLSGQGDPTIALAQSALPPSAASDTPRWMILCFAALAALVLEAALALLLSRPRAQAAPALAALAPSRAAPSRAHR